MPSLPGFHHNPPLEINRKRNQVLLISNFLDNEVVTAAAEACRRLKKRLFILGEPHFQVPVEATLCGNPTLEERQKLLMETSLGLAIQSKSQSDFDDVLIVEMMAAGVPLCALESNKTALDLYCSDGVTGLLWQAERVTTDVVERAINKMPFVDRVLLRKMMDDLYSVDVYLQRLIDLLEL